MPKPRPADPWAVPAATALDVAWCSGTAEAEPAIQVYDYEPDTVLLRQGIAVDFEAPFMFLFFGASRAVLVDTGATGSPADFPLRRTVDGLIERWLSRRPSGMPPHEAPLPGEYGLLVLHTHAHGDHVAGDGQFAGRANTVVVGAAKEESWAFFGFDDDDPDRVAKIEAGGRALECFAAPGHHPSAVVFYDARTGFLLTGDTVYPGRLYVGDRPAFERTLARMIRFTGTRPVSHVLGCHIEMSRRPGEDYPRGAPSHPGERPLEMAPADLGRVAAAIAPLGPEAGRHVFDDFIIVIGG